MGKMFTELLEPVPITWKVPILVLFFVMILVTLCLLAGYSFRTPLFEFGPGRPNALNSEILEIKQLLLKREEMPALGDSGRRLPLSNTTSRPALERFFSAVEEVDGCIPPSASKLPSDPSQERIARPSRQPSSSAVEESNSAVEEIKPAARPAGGGVKKAVNLEAACRLTPVKAAVVVAPDVGRTAASAVNLSTARLTSPTTGALDLRKDVIQSSATLSA